MSTASQNLGDPTLDEFSRALAATADSVMICDAAGVIRFVNRAFESLTGYNLAEARGQTPRLLRSGLMLPDFYRAFWATILAGESFRGEFVNRARDGRIYVEEKYVTPLKTSTGVITGFVSTGRDVTEQRRIRAELDARAAQHEVLARIASVAIEAPDPEVVEWEIAAALAASLGADTVSVYEQSQRTRHLRLAARYPGTSAETRTVLLPVLQTIPFCNSPECGRTLVVHPGGTTTATVPMRADEALLGAVALNWKAHRELGQQEMHFLQATAGILANAIRRQRHVEALRLSEERYLNLWQGANDIIWTSNLSGRFTSLNRAGEELLGYSSAEFCQFTLADILSPSHQRLVDSLLESGRDSKSGRTWEIDLLCSDAHLLPVEVRLRPFVHEGRVVGVQAIARDVAERRHLEQQLRHSQKMEAMGTLAGGIAHDFNNLLTVLIGNTELLLVRPGLDPQVQTLVQETRSAANRAALLVHQLLAFSRKQSAVAVGVDLNSLVAGMLDMMRRLLTERIRLEADLQPGLAQILADPGQFEQVLLNLVINARDAIEGNGEIFISTFPLQVPEQLAAGARLSAGNYVVVRVRDNGAGIDPAVKDRIFEPFFTTKEVGKGSGLGLATAYGIVRQSGGTIWVDSTPGAGASFHVAFPALDRAPAVSPSSDRRPV